MVYSYAEMLLQRRSTMKLDEVKKIAKQKCVKTTNLKKGEIIRAIQMAEGYSPCFDMQKSCSQNECLWKTACPAEVK